MKHGYRILTVMMALGMPAMAAVGSHDKDKDRSRKADRTDWAEMRQKWAEQTKAQDAELERMMNEVNSASGQGKVDAMARVLERLVNQRKQMHNDMRSMHERMGGKWSSDKDTGTTPGSSTTPGSTSSGSTTPGSTGSGTTGSGNTGSTTPVPPTTPGTGTTTPGTGTSSGQ